MSDSKSHPDQAKSYKNVNNSKLLPGDFNLILPWIQGQKLDPGDDIQTRGKDCEQDCRRTEHQVGNSFINIRLVVKQ